MSFTEEQAHWQIPMNEVNIVCDVTTANGICYHSLMQPDLRSNECGIIKSCGFYFESESLFSFIDSIYVATCNPVSLYAMKENGDSVQCIELYDIFPRTSSGVWQPFVSVAALGNPLQDQVVLHEEQVCLCVCV